MSMKVKSSQFLLVSDDILTGATYQSGVFHYWQLCKGEQSGIMLLDEPLSTEHPHFETARCLQVKKTCDNKPQQEAAAASQPHFSSMLLFR